MHPIARKRISAAKKIITFAFHLDRRRARVSRYRPVNRDLFRVVALSASSEKEKSGSRYSLARLLLFYGCWRQPDEGCCWVNNLSIGTLYVKA